MTEVCSSGAAQWPQISLSLYSAASRCECVTVWVWSGRPWKRDCALSGTLPEYIKVKKYKNIYCKFGWEVNWLFFCAILKVILLFCHRWCTFTKDIYSCDLLNLQCLLLEFSWKNNESQTYRSVLMKQCGITGSVYFIVKQLPLQMKIYLTQAEIFTGEVMY